MESVIVITSRPYDAEFRTRLAAVWAVMDTSRGGLVIEEGGTRVYVSRDDAIAAEMGPEERGQIAAVARDAVFYSIDFSDIDLCGRVLLAIADDPQLLVDNDHGVVLPGAEFVRVLRSQPDWDWRRDAVPLGR